MRLLLSSGFRILYQGLDTEPTSQSHQGSQILLGMLTDEVSCHNVEQMPLCIRFVDKDCNIREKFLEFVALERVTGSAIGMERYWVN